MKSDKPTKKRNRYNEAILNALAGKYGYTVDYVRKCLRDDRVGLIPDLVKKDYNVALAQAVTAIEKQPDNQKH